MLLEEIEQIIEIEINSLSFFYFYVLFFDKILYTYNRGGIMKCDNCGKTIEDANALTCPFCNAELKSPTEEIEVLDEEVKEEEPKVEESLEPSIISSEEISIDSIGVEKPKKKKNKKKKKSDESEEAQEEIKDEEEKEEKVVEEDLADKIEVPIEQVSPTEEVQEETKEEVEDTVQTEEQVVEEQTSDESDKAYEPFVEADNVVPLPPKKTIWYRIKDFYRSWFEGYEKLPEIKVDNRETRLTLDKIYEKSSKEAEEKKISGNDVAIVWLACFVFAFIAFFMLTALSFIVDIIVGDKNNTSILTVIIPVFQIGIPIFFVSFGWLIGIVYSYIKRNKKRNR